MILGLALERITGQPLAVALQEQVLGPLGLTNTVACRRREISEPVLHAFSSERRQALGIPAGTPFYEESTYWNPSWTLAQGAIQTTNIYDMAATAVAIGEGTLLSPESHQAQVDPDLLGFGSPLDGLPHLPHPRRDVQLRARRRPHRPLAPAEPALRRLRRGRGLSSRQEDRHRGRHHLRRESFDDQGNYKYSSHSAIFAAIGNYLAPDDPLPAPKS